MLSAASEQDTCLGVLGGDGSDAGDPLSSAPDFSGSPAIIKAGRMLRGGWTIFSSFPSSLDDGLRSPRKVKAFGFFLLGGLGDSFLKQGISN